jgi:hypothetical protein
MSQVSQKLLIKNGEGSLVNTFGSRVSQSICRSYGGTMEEIPG